MNVRFYATYRAIVGAKSVEVSIPAGASVRQLLAETIQRFPALRSELLDEHGELHRHVHVFINGRDTYYLPENMETGLDAQDTVDIFPPVAGG